MNCELFLIIFFSIVLNFTKAYLSMSNYDKNIIAPLTGYSTDIFGRKLRCDYTNPRIKHSCVLGCMWCKRALMRHYDIGKCCDKCYETSAEIVDEPPEKCSPEFYLDNPISFIWDKH